MNIDLSGQRALVTGGTKGIGRAIVDSLVAAGAHAVVIGSDPDGLQALSERAEVRGRIVCLCLDLADDEALNVQARRLGEEAFHILVNNAGVNVHGTVGTIPAGDFDRVLQVNLRAPFALCQAIVPGMAARGYGRVVSITSIFSTVSKSGRASYTASKFALAGLTRTLALDYAGQGVLANSVAPGFIETDMTSRMLREIGTREMVAAVPLGRLGQPEEVAALVAFLASPLNTFMTGQNLIIDGGFTSV